MSSKISQENKRFCSRLFHLYKTQKLAKLICYMKSQDRAEEDSPVEKAQGDFWHAGKVFNLGVTNRSVFLL